MPPRVSCLSVGPDDRHIWTARGKIIVRHSEATVGLVFSLALLMHGDARSFFIWGVSSVLIDGFLSNVSPDSHFPRGKRR